MRFPKRLHGGLPVGSTTPIRVRKPAYRAAELARILDWLSPPALLRQLRNGGVDLWRGRVWVSHIRRNLPEIYDVLMAKLRKLEAGDDSPLDPDDLDEEEDAA